MKAHELVLIDLDSETGPVKPSPGRSVGDRNALPQEIILHHLSGLLVADGGIRSREHDMLGGGRGETEFAVRVLAHLPSLVMAHLVEHVPAADRAHPVLAVAKIVSAAA